MESQMQGPSHGHHHHEEDPYHATGLHIVVEGEGEGEHHEKKSVLKKVKDKAKKIKNTITKHGHEHGHQHGHEYRHDQVSEEEDEDEDEEMVNDPEVHGAPIYDSAVITGTSLPLQTGSNLEKATKVREDRYNPNVRDHGETRPSAMAQTVPELGRPYSEARVHETKTALRSSPYPSGQEEINVGEPRVKIGQLTGLEEDPHSPKHRPREIPPSNYQAKVTDPTGERGKEADVEPLLQRLDNLKVRDEPILEQKSYTGSHDQFAPQITPTKEQFYPEGTAEKHEETPKSLDTMKPELMPTDTITGKISAATTAIAGAAASAKNVVTSKLGYGDGGENESGHDAPKKPITETAAEYGHMVAEKLTPIYDKVAGAGTAALSKVQGGGAAKGSGDTGIAEGTNKGVSVKEYLVEKFTPGDEDKALKEVITDAFHKKKEEGIAKEGKIHQRPMGRVTESVEVVERLGTGNENKREGEDAFVSGSESSGEGIVDRLKDAVSLWLGKSAGIETAQQSLGQSHVSDGGAAPGGGLGQSKEGVSKQ